MQLCYIAAEKITELKNHDVIETGKIKNKTSSRLVKKQKYVHLHKKPRGLIKYRPYFRYCSFCLSGCAPILSSLSRKLQE